MKKRNLFFTLPVLIFMLCIFVPDNKTYAEQHYYCKDGASYVEQIKDQIIGYDNPEIYYEHAHWNDLAKQLYNTCNASVSDIALQNHNHVLECLSASFENDGYIIIPCEKCDAYVKLRIPKLAKGYLEKTTYTFEELVKNKYKTDKQYDIDGFYENFDGINISSTKNIFPNLKTHLIDSNNKEIPSYWSIDVNKTIDGRDFGRLYTDRAGLTYLPEYYCVAGRTYVNIHPDLIVSRSYRNSQGITISPHEKFHFYDYEDEGVFSNVYTTASYVVKPLDPEISSLVIATNRIYNLGVVASSNTCNLKRKSYQDYLSASDDYIQYELQCSTNRNFKNYITKKGDLRKLKFKINKTYYFRIRLYYKQGNQKFLSKWSPVFRFKYTSKYANPKVGTEAINKIKRKYRRGILNIYLYS